MEIIHNHKNAQQASFVRANNSAGFGVVERKIKSLKDTAL
jgi:hypothetical protein